MSTKPTGTILQGDAQQRYEQLVASIDGIVWEVDLTAFQFTFVSQQAEGLLGYPVQQWLTPGFWLEHLHPDDQVRVQEFCQQVARGQDKRQVEYRMIAADGRTRWFRDNISAITAGDQRIKLCGVMIDITECRQIAPERQPQLGSPEKIEQVSRAGRTTWTGRFSETIGKIARLVSVRRSTTAEKQMVGKSEASNARFRAFLDHTADALFLHNEWGVIVDANEQAYKSLGYTRSELIGMTPLQYDLNVDIQFLRQLKVRIKAGETVRIETHYRRKDGTEFPVEVYMRGFWDEGRGFNVVRAQDITERKRAEDELRASEARFRTFVDHATDVFCLHDDQGIIQDLNHRAFEDLGYMREEMIGEPALKFVTDVAPESLQEIGQRLRAGEIVTFEATHRRKDGTTFPAEVRLRPFWDGGRMFVVSLYRDITDRKQTQDALTLFRSLLDHTQDTIEVIDPITGRYLDINEHGCQVHGYTREEFLTLSVPDIDPLVAAAGWEVSLGNVPWEGVQIFESQHRRKDGSIFPVEVNSNYIRLERDYLVTIVRDITERKQAGSALKESEEQYRILYEDNPSMYFTLAADGTVLSVNRFGAECLGYTVPELLGKSVLNVFHEEDKAAALEAVGRCLAHAGTVFHWSLRKVRKDGTLLWVDETARAVHKKDGSLVLLVVCEDITERKRTEQALVESHNLLNAVVEGTADAVYIKDLQGRYLMINSAGARFLGKRVDEIIGKSNRELFTTDTNEMGMNDRQVLATGQARVYEETATAEGVTRTYLSTKGCYRDAQGEIMGIIGISRDITELKGLEEQFRQAQKMEAVGQLAGGVAHDFNNLLTVINGYSGLVLKRLPEDNPNRKPLTEIQKAGERAANLTRQLLAFSRKQVLQPQVVSLNTLLGDLLKLLRPLLGEDIELALLPDAALGLAKVDPGQFEQAIINLAVNARDAMPQGGRLTITTQNTVLTAEFVERYPEVRPGHYILVAVNDSGQGMDAATMARIFEPFFTTKGPGKGTGLGLAMVYGFVKQSGGHIEVSSTVDGGTIFNLYLPHADESTPSPDVPLHPLAFPSGTEVVLLVEDEDAVRSLARQVLQSSGYTVIEAPDGQEALLVAAQHPGPIDILVTDLVMPRMSGRQLADLMSHSRPQIGVLFMSGYTDEAVLRHGVREGSVTFLQKPFNPSDLAWKVREVLNAVSNQ